MELNQYNDATLRAPRIPLSGPAASESGEALLLPYAAEARNPSSLYQCHVISGFAGRFSKGDDHRGYPNWIDPTPSEGFVYAAIYPDSPGVVKIGETRFYPTRRMESLTKQTAAPSEVRMLFAFETPFRRQTEKAAHDALRSVRIKGEWFNLSQDALLGVMFALAEMHHDRGYGWRLWTTPEFLGIGDASVARALCAAGMGADPTACDFMGQECALAA